MASSVLLAIAIYPKVLENGLLNPGKNKQTINTPITYTLVYNLLLDQSVVLHNDI